MDFPFSPSKWIPEDDLLLKNAVEAGASLESLAKGAVCFSCKFDIQELQDRWFSLLYDLDTSIEASSRIVEIEIEHDVPNPRNLNRSFKSIRKEFPLRKRKVDSIQDLYYRMRKRMCSEPFIQQTHHRAGQYDEQYPFPEFAEDGLQVHGSISNRPFYTETMDQDVTVYPPTYVESNNIILSSLAANSSDFNNSMDNLQHPHFQPNLSDWRVRDFTGQSGHMDYHLSKNGKMKPANDAVLCKISISETIKLNQFSVDCLYSNLNITKEENPFKIDIGESDFVLSFDLGDYLLNSPCDASQDGLPSMTSNPAEDILEIPAVTDVESSPELVCDSMNSSLENDHAAKASSDTSDLDESQALMICVLNIQDLEVPTNDDVTFPSEDLQAGFQENLEIYNSHLCENSSLEHANGISKEFLKLTEEHIAVAKESLKEKSSDFMANVGLSEWGSVVRSGKNIENKLDRSISANFDSNNATVYKRTWTVAGSDSPAQHNHVLATEKSGNAVIHCCDQNSETSISDAEDKIFECDEAIPHFSDIEAMILDIDLNAIDHKDWALSKEVSRYWPLATKKVILKLEQAARSCIDRETSSHGAFAVFYGRILKYFIRHAQILIGRATRDVKVDIDLGLEGFAKKISRRQAIIKMDEDGSFWLINIGCHSFFVNGKEVPSRKRTNLGSSSLIEITGMAFIFEVNRRAMEHYIASQCENVQTL